MLPKFNSMSQVIMIMLIAAIALVTDVKAQNLQALLSNANIAHKQGDYEGSRNILNQVTEKFGRRAPMLYGPKFGIIYYRKGLCELKLAGIAKRARQTTDAQKWFEAAATSFEKCYTDFPNGGANMAPTVNTAHKTSLQRRAEAKMGLKDYDEALRLYVKFLAERDSKKDKPQPSPEASHAQVQKQQLKIDTESNSASLAALRMERVRLDERHTASGIPSLHTGFASK